MTQEQPAKKWRFDFIGGSEEISDETEDLREESFFPLSQAKIGDRVCIVGLLLLSRISRKL